MKKVVIWMMSHMFVVSVMAWFFFDFIVNLRSEYIKFDTILRTDRPMYTLCKNSTIENTIAKYNQICRDMEAREAVGAFALALKSMLDPDWLKDIVTAFAVSLGYMFIPSCVAALAVVLCCPTALYMMLFSQDTSSCRRYGQFHAKDHQA